MANRVYNVIGANVTALNAAIGTMVTIRPSTSMALLVRRMWLSQHANVTSAQLRIGWGYQATAFSTVAAATPQKTTFGDPASGITGGTAQAAGTCGVAATAEGAGTKTEIGCDAFNALNGWLWVPTPGETIILQASMASAFYLAFTAQPATLTNWNVGLTFEELG